MADNADSLRQPAEGDLDWPIAVDQRGAAGWMALGRRGQANWRP